MTYVRNFFGNYLLMSAISGWLVAQILKMFTGLLSRDNFNIIKLLFSNGGMPSSHSATVMALTTASAVQYGLGSAYFAITAVLAFIVMNDAAGVRYQTGKQAKILNRILEDFFSDDPKIADAGLKELVGHTPLQVFMGALTGIGVGIGMGFLMQVILI